MKKYTQPTVEITAFDFEDITMSSMSAENIAANSGAKEYFNYVVDNASNAGNLNVVEW